MLAPSWWVSLCRLLILILLHSLYSWVVKMSAKNQPMPTHCELWMWTVIKLPLLFPLMVTNRDYYYSHEKHLFLDESHQNSKAWNWILESIIWRHTHRASLKWWLKALAKCPVEFLHEPFQGFKVCRIWHHETVRSESFSCCLLYLHLCCADCSRRRSEQADWKMMYQVLFCLLNLQGLFIDVCISATVAMISL